VCEGKRVIGYCALASGAIAQASVPGKFRRNMPDPIPVAVLARLAVDRSQQGRGLGRAISLALADAGADVALGLRDVNTGDALTRHIEAMGRRARDLALSRYTSEHAVSQWLAMLDAVVPQICGRRDPLRLTV